MLGLELDAVSGKGYRLSRPLELLQRDQIIACLDTNSRARLKELEILPEIDSTNRYLMNRTETGLACFAEFQNSGRGRRGGNWHSPFAANIYLSLTWRFDDTTSVAASLGLAAGVWIAEALQDTGITGIGLKWPNDVLYNGAKLAGVLVEIKKESTGSCRAVIGVGLNIDMPDTAAQYIEQPWTDIRTITGQQPQRNLIAGVLLHNLLNGLSCYQTDGPAAMLERWNELDCMAGHQVQLHQSSGILTGTAQGIDETGALQLLCEEGLCCVHSGEVRLRLRPNTTTR